MKPTAFTSRPTPPFIAAHGSSSRKVQALAWVAASAVTAAFLAIEPDAFAATAAAIVAFGLAGEIAGAQAAGPGSFASAMLDALYRLDADTIGACARIQ